MFRLLHFSNENDEYVVLTDELGVDAEEWLMMGYELKADLGFTPHAPSHWHSLPLGYELRRSD